MNRIPPKKELVVEGWRFICHSYAIVNQWQLLALLRRNEVALHIRDVPFFNPNWKRVEGLFSPAQEAVLAELPMADANTIPATTLRISFPYNFSPLAQGRLAVFGTAEYGVVPPSYLTGSNDIASLAQNERLPLRVMVRPGHDFHDEAGIVVFLDRPGRREAAGGIPKIKSMALSKARNWC